MAVNTPIDVNETRVLKNGARQDVRTGKIVAGAVLDADKARTLQKLAVEKKREVIQQAANEAVQNRDLSLRYADNAYLAEIAQVQQIIATTPEAGQAAVKAADWLVTNTGKSEKQAEQAQTVTNNVLVLDDTTRGLLLSLLGDTYATPIEAVAEDVNAYDNDSYRNHEHAFHPPLTHSAACLPCAGNSTQHAELAHTTDDHTHPRKQTGRHKDAKKDERKVVGV